VNPDYATAVREFQTKFEASTDPALWVKLVEEEWGEVEQAVADLLKELADLDYVGTGLVNLVGDLDNLEPALKDRVEKVMRRMCHIADLLENVLTESGSEVRQEAFARVHASNMSKLDPVTGKPIRREDGKILKGPDYQPPVLIDLIRKE
jgi:predicted HAD superfamily Cof-like phosphohydrolase